MRHALVAVAALMISYPACAQRTAVDQERLAAITHRMQTFVDSGSIAGAVMLLTRRDTVVFLEAVGYADLSSRRPMETDGVFQLASIAKPIAATAAMILQEEGRLSIVDPIDRYLSRFGQLGVGDSPEPLRYSPTLRQLMTHSSGMGDDLELLGLDSDSAMMEMSLAEVVDRYMEVPLAYRPGSRYSYSNAGFDVLGRVIELTSGQSYEAFVEERLFRPLGMTDTGFFPSSAQRARLSSFYHFEDGRLLEARPGSHVGDLPAEARRFVAPAFGLYSTAPDLGAFLQMTLNGGAYRGTRVLSEASIDAMRSRPSGREDLPLTGWVPSRGGPLQSSRAYGHSGATGAWVWVDPEWDLAGVFLIHQPDDAEALHALRVFQAMAYSAISMPRRP